MSDFDPGTLQTHLRRQLDEPVFCCYALACCVEARERVYRENMLKFIGDPNQAEDTITDTEEEPDEEKGDVAEGLDCNGENEKVETNEDDWQDLLSPVPRISVTSSPASLTASFSMFSPRNRPPSCSTPPRLPPRRS